MKEQVWDQAKGKLEGCIAFLRDIIRIPSTSCKEADVVQRIRQEMDRLGFDEVRIDAMGNVIGRMGDGPIKLLFDSHVDTVDIGDRSRWPHDPFEGKVEDGIIYGRGASDNKGATAVQVYGAAIAKELGLLDGVTLYVIGTVQEEDCDGLALHYAMTNSGLDVDYVVLGECTDLAVYRGHRGRMEIRIHTDGKSCHASAPHRGDNAIYKMAPLVSGVEELNSRLADDAFLGKGTVAVTHIDCVTASLNAVPDQCEVILDRRLTKGETLESAVAEIQALPGAERATVEVLRYDTRSHTGLEVSTDKYYPTWVLEEEHELVQASVVAGEQARGTVPPVDKWTFSTNGIASMGQLGVPTVGFGPSREEYAHTMEDQVPIDHLEVSMRFYALLPQALVAARS